MLIETILSALVPMAVDGIGKAITKWTGGVQPQTVDDKIKLQESDNATLEALAKLDNPYGTPSQWVVDLRASSRYIMAAVVILGGIATMYTPSVTEPIRFMALEGVSVVFGFLFGHRMVINYNSPKK
jgi:hypothetical protein